MTGKSAPKSSSSWFQDRLGPHRREFSVGLTVVFLAVFLSIHFRLISDTFFVDGAGNLRSTADGGGDICHHLTQISKFAFAPSFNFNEPTFFGNRISYHFILNMLKGWLLAWTGNWVVSVLWPVYLLALANAGLLFYVYKRVLKSNWLAIVAFLTFFLGAGTANWAVLRGQPARRLIDFSAVFPRQNVDFGPVLSMSFLHQQAFFLGTLVFLLFLINLLRLKENQTGKSVIATGIFLGLLPIVHVHSFIAAVVVLATEMALQLGRPAIPRLKRLLSVAAIGAVLALPQVFFLLASKSVLGAHAKFVTFRLGWMVAEGIGSVKFPTAVRSVLSTAFLDFLWVNFGVLLPLFLACLVVLIARRHLIATREKEQLSLLAGSGLAIFVAIQIIQFQPWDFDNNKVLVYFLLLTAPFMVWTTARFLGPNKLFRSVAVLVLLLAATFSGVVDIGCRLRTAKADLPIIFDVHAQRMAEYVRSNVTDSRPILSSTTHRNPVSSLAGRQVLVGYPGWLWAEGVDYASREWEIRKFYSEPSPDSPLLAKYGIKHILLDPMARNDYRADPAVFDRLFKKEFQVGDYSLYGI